MMDISKIFLYNDLTAYVDKAEYKIFVNNNYINPIIQQGPTCGLVLLSMISGMSVDKIFNIAKSYKFTNCGEIFSIEHFNKLAIMCGLDSTLNSLDDSITYNFFEYIANGKLIILAYDSDKDFRPCCVNGTKAHWAVLTGFVFVLKSESCHISTSPLLNYKNVYKHEASRNILEPLDLFLIAQHGKSKNSAVWAYNDLVKSNKNLMDMGDHNRQRLGYHNGHIDLNLTLANQYLVITPSPYLF